MWGPQRPKFWILAEDFGFWGFWILDLGDFGFWGFWILDLGDFGFWGRNPKSKIPQSKIQNPNFFGRFWGFWILDFGPLCSKSLCEAPNAPNLGHFGFWGFWILGILDFGFWGFWILDFGPLCSKSLCEAPNAPNLGHFGFWGFWSLGILDFGFCDKFWILHKKKKTVHADPGRRIFCYDFERKVRERRAKDARKTYPLEPCPAQNGLHLAMPDIGPREKKQHITMTFWLLPFIRANNNRFIA